MTTSKTMITLALLSALCAAPASANWFNDSMRNTHLNIGSAPNPKPEDLRRLYGSERFAQAPVSRAAVAQTHVDEEYFVPSSYADERQSGQLSNLEGRMVFGSKGERLGYILAVDEDGQLAQLQTRSGVAVAVPAALLVAKADRIEAPTMTRPDVIAMAKTQTGRMTAMNIDTRGPLRG